MSEAAPILSVRNVSKHFGGVQALSKVSFDVHPGEVVALAGDNGAGKSTVIKAISGVFHYDEGDIELDGRRIAFSSPQEARDNGIETIYQDLALADNLSIGANIFLGREPMTKLLRLPAGHRPQDDGRGGEGDHGEARLPRQPPRCAGRGVLGRAAPGGGHRPRHVLERAPRHHGRADGSARRARAAAR